MEEPGGACGSAASTTRHTRGPSASPPSSSSTTGIRSSRRVVPSHTHIRPSSDPFTCRSWIRQYSWCRVVMALGPIRAQPSGASHSARTSPPPVTRRPMVTVGSSPPLAGGGGAAMLAVRLDPASWTTTAAAAVAAVILSLDGGAGAGKARSNAVVKAALTSDWVACGNAFQAVMSRRWNRLPVGRATGAAAFTAPSTTALTSRLASGAGTSGW